MKSAVYSIKQLFTAVLCQTAETPGRQNPSPSCREKTGKQNIAVSPVL
jgi:hypothetical protein